MLIEAPTHIFAVLGETRVHVFAVLDKARVHVFAVLGETLVNVHAQIAESVTLLSSPVSNGHDHPTDQSGCTGTDQCSNYHIHASPLQGVEEGEDSMRAYQSAGRARAGPAPFGGPGRSWCGVGGLV
ncbi:MAG: hypothetical protein F4Z06_03185 [Acidimicrobiia bacterium]|nr:hypothetical protein [Acidimicrobiia bacterium]